MSATHTPYPPLTCVCAWCGRWRDSSDRWHDRSTRPATDDKRPVSHGICPDCLSGMLSDQSAEDTLPN